MLFLFLALGAQSTYDQLLDLNKYWADHSELGSSLFKKNDFLTHQALIQYHLQNVEQELRTKSNDHLSPSQKANREQGLNALKKYWMAGQFPINTRHSYTLPYFIDDYNTACAVGHIMLESGAEELACRIAAEDNNAYLEDMHFKEIGEWACEMGFEIAELKWIQPSYPPTLTLYPEVTEPTCHNSDGAIDLTVSSGFGTPIIDPTELDYHWQAVSNNTDFEESERRQLERHSCWLISSGNRTYWLGY